MKEDSEVITSSAILHLTVKDVNEILPDYLVLVINSSIVRLQAERDAGGSIIQHWKPSEIGEVLIPIIDIQMQKELVAQIQEAFVLLKESDIKLKKAINIVEKAIEQSKPGAIEFFDLIEWYYSSTRVSESFIQYNEGDNKCADSHVGNTLVCLFFFQLWGGQISTIVLLEDRRPLKHEFSQN